MARTTQHYRYSADAVWQLSGVGQIAAIALADDYPLVARTKQTSEVL
jgi:hypothetical protein